MEENFRRPLYEDFKKHAWARLMDDRPIHSRERLYEYADRPLILFSYFLMYAAFYSILFLLPKPDNIVYLIILFTVFITFAVLSLTLYRRWFIYRFARFNVLWEDWQHPGTACEGCDEQGYFLLTKENRKAAVKSRAAFAILLAVIAAAVVLFYTFTWGMAEQRIRSSPQLAEFARLAEKQGDISIDVYSRGVGVSGGDTPKYITNEDEERFESIYKELQWNYLERLSWNDGTIHVFMHGWFQSK